MKAISTLSAALVLSFGGAAAAQQTATPEDQNPSGIPATEHQEQTTREVAGDTFTRLDQDGDGQISQQEAQAESALSAHWSRLDENGDGRLDPQEFSAFESHSEEEREATAGTRGQTEEGMPATRHQETALEDDLLGQLDQDGDAQISQQEAQAESQLADNWDQLDENQDGMLDSSELSQLEERLAEIEEAE